MAETMLKEQEERARALVAHEDDVSAVFLSHMYDETKLTLRVLGGQRERSVLASHSQLHVQRRNGSSMTQD
eukprot:5608318-Prorocentrum_lima.AAC.1